MVISSGLETAALEGLAITANSPAAANVLVKPGAALVNGTNYYNSSDLTLSIAANASGNPRIDVIVLRKSFAAQTVRAVVLQGTPAASPTPPALTQSAGITWEIPLAEIAVASGFVTITQANITPRAMFATASDGDYLDRIQNTAGSDAIHGDAFTLSQRTAAPQGVNAKQWGGVLGAWQGRTPTSSYGRMLNRGIGYVRTNAAVTAGQWGQWSATQRQLQASSERLINSYAYFLETTSVAGLALAWVDGHGQEVFGPVAATNRLGAPAASIAASSTVAVHNTWILEFYLRSVIVATNEIVNIRLLQSGSVVDTTAGNYYSYSGRIAAAAAAVAATQNLGATAGWQIVIPGSTAPANAYAYGIIQINNAASPSNIIHGTGHYYSQIANTDGNLLPYIFGARWINTVSGFEGFNAVTSGANNFAAGSYLNIYAKQTWGSTP